MSPYERPKNSDMPAISSSALRVVVRRGLQPHFRSGKSYRQKARNLIGQKRQQQVERAADDGCQHAVHDGLACAEYGEKLAPEDHLDGAFDSGDQRSEQVGERARFVERSGRRIRNEQRPHKRKGSGYEGDGRAASEYRPLAAHDEQGAVA